LLQPHLGKSPDVMLAASESAGCQVSIRLDRAA